MLRFFPISFLLNNNNNNSNNNNNNTNNNNRNIENIRVTRLDHNSSQVEVSSLHTWHTHPNTDAISCTTNHVYPCVNQNNSATVAIISATAAVLIIIGMVSTYVDWWLYKN